MVKFFPYICEKLQIKNMASICFDIGNTFIKIAMFKGNEMVSFRSIEHHNLQTISQIVDEVSVEAAIISSVSEIPSGLEALLKNKTGHLILLDFSTKLPIENCYETKETLGKDRLAAVIGANYLYPGTDILIIDAGTAITYDFINEHGQYLGGNISPGIQMRYKSLHQFTNRLPLIEMTQDMQTFGRNTTEAIRAGVQNGIVFEADGTIDYFKQLYPGLRVLFTGGDAKFFDNKLKNVIFVVSNLVMVGLNRILAYNVQNL
jgi:type III pantothenate kinase